MPKRTVKTQTQPAAATDAKSMLAGLDKESLARQIEAARAKVAEATAEMKALLTLEKVRAIRAGEIKFGGKRKQHGAGQPAAGDGKPEGDADQSVRGKITNYLHKATRASETEIADATGLNPNVLHLFLQQHNSSLVRPVMVGGKPQWELR